ncbi:restriction endonuclease [Burkholderiaceae bacterium]|nr:restriction endonuclease [Burkholderiaceae bacterium]
MTESTQRLKSKHLSQVTDKLPSLDISAPQIIIVADGETPSGQATARGHLFERFVARLFEAHGCAAPSKSTMNVRQSGYEVDIKTNFTLSREPAIAECKAYSAVLPLSALSNFYGKLTVERFDNPNMHGWFVAVPGMTADGHELARKLEANDKLFRLVTATEIYQLVVQKSWAIPIPAQENLLLSDHALLLSENGLAALVKELDPATRLPSRVLVQSTAGAITASEITLLAATAYASGLTVHDSAESNKTDKHVHPTDSQTLVTVVGSGNDFEYQFPASPPFFVGREEILARIKKLPEDGRTNGRVIVLNAQSGWGKSSLALRIAHQVEKAGGSAAVFDTRTAATPTYVAAALQKAIKEAEAKGKLSLPVDASFASLQSALRTLQDSVWRPSASLLIFFDQFENVFRDVRLTEEFRNLTLSIRELSVPVLLGFCWKTDLVALTENYPYRLRDEIRGASLVINVEPFGLVKLAHC